MFDEERVAAEAEAAVNKTYSQTFYERCATIFSNRLSDTSRFNMIEGDLIPCL